MKHKQWILIGIKNTPSVYSPFDFINFWTGIGQTLDRIPAKAKMIILTGILIGSCAAPIKRSDPLLLRYDTPASQWEEALPIGNGRVGGMVYGSPAEEHIQLNEETIWAGEPGNNVPADTYNNILAARNLIFEQHYQEANDTLMQAFPRLAAADNNYGMPYQTAGDLYIHFPDHERVSHYERTLDISQAIARTTYTIDSTTFLREVFTAFANDVLVIRLTATRPGQITCELKLKSPHAHQSLHTSGTELGLSAYTSTLDNKQGKVHFDIIAKSRIENGKQIATDSSLIISHADEALLFVSIASNFKDYRDLSADSGKKARSLLNSAFEKSYSELKTAHISHYQSFFDRVALDLGQTDSARKTTDRRLGEFASANDPSLISLYFQFGRYLLICCSQPGTQPANLQGLWNNQLHPPWDSKYTLNINTEMNYWPAEVTNLSELHTPLFDMIADLAVSGQESARSIYHTNGWVAHHNTDIWRITGPVDGAFYGMWPMGGIWLCQHLWEHYLFTGDTVFLKKAYPLLRGAATFASENLQRQPGTNWLVIAPSISPENRHPEGVSVAAGNTMDNQLIFDLFNKTIAAASILNIDTSFQNKLHGQLDSLPSMHIGQYGQLQEWLYDWDRINDHHRHVSHLYGLYPGNQISPFSTPELFAAAAQSLRYRGDKSTGWSMGWKVNLWARLLDGNRAMKLITDQLTPILNTSGESGGTYSNLLDAHPPFQIDGNFGCTAGIAEMLLQSHDEALYLLPALPDQLEHGSVTGLKARGGFEVDIHWENHQPTELRIHSILGGMCRLRLNQPVAESDGLTMAQGPNPNPFFQQFTVKHPVIKNPITSKNQPHTYLYDLNTLPGQTYFLKLTTL